MKSNVYLLILFTLSLAACQQVRAIPSPSVAFSPAETATEPPPTPIGPGLTPTLSPRDIASSVLTELLIDTTREYSPNGYCQWERLLASSISEAAQRKYNRQFFTYARVTCEKEWVLVEEWKEQNLGYSIPELLGWSLDEKYVYFYDAVIPDGCQPLGGFQENLRQVELATGRIRAVPVAWTGGLTLAPDSMKLVYYDWESMQVGVYDLASEEEQRIRFELPEQIDYWYAGNFTWSPDGQIVLFVIQYGDPCFPIGGSTRRVDIQNHDVSTLVDNIDPTVEISEWTDLERVLISSEGKNLWLDPVSGSLEVP